MNRIPIESRFLFHVHPLAATGYFVALMALLLMFNHVGIVGTAFGGLILLDGWYLGFKQVGWQLKYSGWLFITIVIFNVLLNQSGGPYLWQVKLLGVTWKLSMPALLYGSVMGLMLVAMLLAFALFNAILTANKLLAVLSPLSPRLALLVVLSMNLVGTLKQTFRQLALFQKTRNIDPASGSVKHRLKVGMRFMNILLEKALAAGMERARSMDARGFGATKRSQYRAFRWQIADSWFLGSSAILFFCLVGLRVGSYGWTGSALTFNGSISLMDSWILGLVGLFLGLPLIFEGVAALWTN
ncbi:energy-coupling factor transporter transmembrane component T [Lentilactobacillus farraginis]|nr:energy-coupling factor transporter transmembrane component T [Lentilactobacillus farraginis]GAF36923.1 transmembrane component CbrV of energizing module of predicted cobalamin ECF transporter [Lentilactobacillus farraginis DSM 18382 = JCM 14108]